jgi:hypothetical protein
LCSLSSSDVINSISLAYTTLSGASNVAMNLLEEDSQLLEEFGVGSPPKSSLGSCIHDRVSTRKNLLIRRVIVDPSGNVRVFCEDPVESYNHLFVTCVFASRVWYDVCR